MKETHRHTKMKEKKTNLMKWGVSNFEGLTRIEKLFYFFEKSFFLLLFSNLTNWTLGKILENVIEE